MKQAFKYYAVIWTVLLAVFHVLAFMPPGWIVHGTFTVSFWMGYVFNMLSFVGQLACAYKVFKAENLTSFYSLPLFSVSYTGLIVTFVVGALCMQISIFSYWVGAAISVAVLAVTAIAVVMINAAAETASGLGEKAIVQSSLMRSLTTDAENLIGKATSAEAKVICQKIYETVRDSDHMSHDRLAGIDRELSKTFRFLQMRSW